MPSWPHWEVTGSFYSTPGRAILYISFADWRREDNIGSWHLKGFISKCWTHISCNSYQSVSLPVFSAPESLCLSVSFTFCPSLSPQPYQHRMSLPHTSTSYFPVCKSKNFSSYFPPNMTFDSTLPASDGISQEASASLLVNMFKVTIPKKLLASWATSLSFFPSPSNVSKQTPLSFSPA